MELGILLSVAIAMAAIFVALSCACSFVNEQAAALFRLRGEKLYTGVLNLVCGQEALANTLFAHPLVDGTSNNRRGIYRGNDKTNRPSYIDGRSFSLAFWDSVQKHVTTAPGATPADLQKDADNAAALALNASTVAAPACTAADDAKNSNAPDFAAKSKVADDAAALAKKLADTATAAQALADAAKTNDAKLAAQADADLSNKLATAVANVDAADKEAQRLQDISDAATAKAKANPTDDAAQAAATTAQGAAAKAAKDAETGRNAAHDATFALTLSREVITDPTKVMGDLALASQRIPNAQLRNSLATLLSHAQGDYAALLKATDDWFNSEMDRVSGWYRRQSQYILIVIAATVVMFTGVDSVELVQRLYANPTLVTAETTPFLKTSASPSPSVANAEQATKDQLLKAAEGLLANEEILRLFHPVWVDVYNWYVAQHLSDDAKKGLAAKISQHLDALKDKTFEDDWVFAITIRNGKLTNIREYIDTQALARASEMDAGPNP